MPHRHLPVLRRTTLAAAPLMAIGACQWGPASENDQDLGGEESTAPPDADQVAAAITAIRTADVLLAAVTTRHIGLSDAFTALTTAHGVHLQLLDADAPEATGAPSATPRVSARSAGAWKQVVTSERQLSRELARLAGEVSSGQLARALASMAAGVVQRVADLPAAPKGDA